MSFLDDLVIVKRTLDKERWNFCVLVLFEEKKMENPARNACRSLSPSLFTRSVFARPGFLPFTCVLAATFHFDWWWRWWKIPPHQNLNNERPTSEPASACSLAVWPSFFHLLVTHAHRRCLRFFINQECYDATGVREPRPRAEQTILFLSRSLTLFFSSLSLFIVASCWEKLFKNARLGDSFIFLVAIRKKGLFSFFVPSYHSQD